MTPRLRRRRGSPIPCPRADRGMEDLLDEYLELDALSRVSVRAEGADPGADRLAAVHRPGKRRVFAARHYLAGKPEVPCRFDVVLLDRLEPPRIEWIRDAFSA